MIVPLANVMAAGWIPLGWPGLVEAVIVGLVLLVTMGRRFPGKPDE